MDMDGLGGYKTSATDQFPDPTPSMDQTRSTSWP